MARYESLYCIGYPDYRISTTSEIWRWSKGRWRLLNPRTTKNGYKRTGLYFKGEEKTFFVSNLVLYAFVGPRPDGMQCRHLDGNPANNDLKNLCWGTPQENWQDRKLHGHDGVGVNNPNCKITELQVLEVRALRRKGFLFNKLVEITGVSKRTISDICNNRTWKHLLKPEGEQNHVDSYGNP